MSTAPLSLWILAYPDASREAALGTLFPERVAYLRQTNTLNKEYVPFSLLEELVIKTDLLD